MECLKLGYDPGHLFWRDAGSLVACHSAAGDFTFQNEFRCRTFRRWGNRMDFCRISCSSLCAAWPRADPTWAASCQPDEAVLTIFWLIWVCFALTYLIAGGAFVAGALIAYAWYLFVHHRAHHGTNTLSLPLLEHHRSHHRFATRNYGVSTTFWDRVFGTILHLHRHG
jgi:hypothetical protein